MQLALGSKSKVVERVTDCFAGLRQLLPTLLWRVQV